MKESAIAAKLLTLLASGVTFERIVAELPMFKTQIESAFEWMKANGQCSATGITEQAARLRELVRRKDQAIKDQDWELAAAVRADECALYYSLGLIAYRGSPVLYTSVDEQLRNLSVLLHDT
jgi:hypothetical protein